MLALLDNTELLRRLVGFDSISRNSNLPIADFISDYLDRPGIRIRRNYSADEAKANLVIEAGPAADPQIRDGLMLSGHMDVVPAEEPEWESEPFRMTEQGDRLVGRGTADMKGFLALAMNRLALTEPSRLRHPLCLFFTYDEELGTLGARRFVESWADPGSLPRNVIIGEPTELKVVRMHKGHLKLRLVFRGVTAHSGYPHLGRNAIEPAAYAITALAALRDLMSAERPPSAEFFPEVPFVPLNVGQIQGGVAVNVVPDRCQVDVGLRVLPGMRAEDLVERVREAVTAAVAGPFELEVSGDSPPFLVAEDRPVVRAASEEMRQSETLSVAYATDAGWLQTAGFDCVIYGPGSIETAHKPNEYLTLDQFRRAETHLDRLVNRFCLSEQP